MDVFIMIKIAVTSSFGIESIVSEELKNLGYSDLKIDNGRVIFEGNYIDVCRSNINLRTADRVLIIIKQFKATTFNELFDGVYEIEWQDILPPDANIYVTGRSVKSALFSIRDCQAITKKAIIEKLKKRYKKDWFEESGAKYPIEVALKNDIATITLDTSGSSLHKRGYRKYIGDAPIKETLASAMIILSRWRTSSETFWDPFCGSGTIAIEAALYAKNIAPGLNKNFISENWGLIDEKLWKEARIDALQKIKQNEKFEILCSDIDGEVLKAAHNNAKLAGVEKDIRIFKEDATKIKKVADKGIIVCNPPYGERISQKDLFQLYKSFGKNLKEFINWRFFILSAFEDFEKAFGRKADRNRKLFNGNIKSYLYFYF